MTRHVWVAAALFATGACGKKGGDLHGKALSTDHFQETIGRANMIGDMQVALDATGEPAAIAFATPAPGWTDPRPAHFDHPPPQAYVAQANCLLKITRGGDFATVDPGQSCHAAGTTLTITGGKVWLAHDVLNVDLDGAVDGGAPYKLVYPILIGSDYALPVK